MILSIIIPVYNVEKYIRRCLNSLLEFANNNTEIIVIDDGSTDGSGIICDEYISLKNVTVVHKKNGGLSDARNTGLLIASGKYVWFVDSDDYVSNEYEKIIQTINRFSPDIIQMNYEIINGEKKVIKKHYSIKEEQIYSGIDFLTCALNTKEYFVPVWTNIYSVNFLRDHNFQFRKGIYHEDEQLTPYLFLTAQKVVHLAINPYKYVIRNNSIAHSNKWAKNMNDLNSIFEENAKFFCKNVQDEKLKKLLLSDMVEKLIFCICSYRIPNYEMENYVSVNFLKANAKNIKTKLRVMLFLHFRAVYFRIYRMNESRK